MSITSALMATSALSTMATSYASSKATTAASNYQASVQDANARISQIQAEDAIRRGDIEAQKIQQKTRQIIGSQRAAGAAQGQDLEGDYSDVSRLTADTAGFGALDVLDTKNNAWREAWGYKVQGNQYSSAAQMTRLTGKSTARTTLLTGGFNAAKGLASSYYLSKNQNAWSLKDLLEE